MTLDKIPAERDKGYVSGGSIDFDSIMIYPSIRHATTGYGTLWRKDKARGQLLSIYPGGHPDITKTSVSAGDIVRVKELYGPAPQAGAAPPADPAQPAQHRRRGSDSNKLAFKPMKVIIGTSTATVRPAPLVTPVVNGSAEWKDYWDKYAKYYTWNSDEGRP